MSLNDHKQEAAQLRALNEELNESLKRCRALLTDCKSKLAANSNSPDATTTTQAPAKTDRA